MARIWTWTIVLVFSSVSDGTYWYQGREEAGGLPPLFGDDDDHRSLMLQYIIHKGCDYVSAFVRSHYMNHYYHSDDDRSSRFLYNPTSKCNWKDEVKRMCSSAHVPGELTHALLDCGQSYSYHALGLKDDAICNGTEPQRGHGGGPSLAVGRSVESRSGINKNQAEKRKTHQKPTKLATPNDSVTLVIPDNSTTSSSQSSSSHIAGTTPSLNGRLERWCAKYSRYVNQKFNLRNRDLVQTNIHWLVKVYKYAEKHRTPRSYIHALVGCGQKYALDAFNTHSLLHTKT